MDITSDPSSGVSALEAARSALAGVRGVLAQLSGAELADAMTAADALRAEASATQVVITTEAAHRGEFVSARRGEADGQWSTRGPLAGAFADLDRPEGRVWARVVTGEIGVPLALTALSEIARLADRLQPAAIPTVADAILDHGAEWGPRDARRVRTRLLAAFGLDGEVEDRQRRLRTAAFLTQPAVSEGDITEYRLGLTPEQSAALEAALGPLSRPIPDPGTGVFDERSHGQRRAEALMTIVTGRAARDGEDANPAAASTALHVTIALADLIRVLDLPSSTVAGCGTVIGSTAAGTLLNPGDIRRLACDADIIPVILGAGSEVLDVGRAARLFTKGQRRALWHRDKGCTWSGCDSPPAWAKAHHLVHWADGGRSDLGNAALLCQRHHTHVHDQRLIAGVHPPDENGHCVTWDTSPGSYDRELPRRLSEMSRTQNRRLARHRSDTAARLRALDGPSPDAGTSDPWATVDPDEDVHIDAVIAWDEAARRGEAPWPDPEELDEVA